MPLPRCYTVHNLAYQGVFPHADFALLGLPARYMTPGGLEFHGEVSCMKAGLKFADRVTTVSPTYAREIATPEFGAGLDGVIRGRGANVCGILNGVDRAVWSPANDAALPARYDADRLDGKAACKAALQLEMGLAPDPTAPLVAVLSRLTSQKGLDLVLGALPGALARGVQWAVVGTGEPALEAAFREAARAHPGRVAVRITYDETLAHRLIAGADAIAVPSRFEPCGLTQLYGLAYGTLPVVRRVGGLADTVVDATAEHLADGSATGFQFDIASSQALEGALERMVALYRRPDAWQRVMRTAMAQDFSWDHAARAIPRAVPRRRANPLSRSRERVGVRARPRWVHRRYDAHAPPSPQPSPATRERGPTESSCSNSSSTSAAAASAPSKWAACCRRSASAWSAPSCSSTTWARWIFPSACRARPTCGRTRTSACPPSPTSSKAS